MSVSLLPLAIQFSHISLNVILVSLIGRTILRSYQALPQNQTLCGRELVRKSHLKLFFALALVSLLFSSYWAYVFRSISYRAWTAGKGIALSESKFEEGLSLGEESLGRLHVSQWLNDISIYHEALESTIKTARYFWWSQQVELTVIPWGLLLSIEGRRRNIPYLWAFMILSQTISLSFAQNLFYVTILLTSFPLPGNNQDLSRPGTTNTSTAVSDWKRGPLQKKPENWQPYPILYLIPLSFSFAALFLLPFTLSTPYFSTVALTFRALCFSPLLLPHVIPEKWGTVDIHLHDFHGAYLRLFRGISIVSALLHGKSTFLALTSDIPNVRDHHNGVLDSFNREQQSMIKQNSTAIGELLGAIGDHPVINALGWDFLLSGLSLGLWATIRRLDANAILFSSGLFHNGTSKHMISDSITVEPKSRTERPSPIKHRGQGRPRMPDQLANHEEHIPPRRRGRPRKTIEPEVNGENEPVEMVRAGQDKAEGECWEIGALVWALVAATGLGAATTDVSGAESTMHE